MKYLFTISSISLLLFLSTELKAQKAVNTELLEYVKQAPDSLNLDYEWLISYLKVPADNEEELAELIFYWIADNISYDFQACETGNYGSQSAVETIIYKKAVCAGYARLFYELSTRSGLECEIVLGHAKGLGYQIGEEWDVNHAWNAVKINEEWRLVDVTWGSGGGRISDNRYDFVKRLKPKYLFANPEEFILKHLPEDSKWQLLKTPISKEDYFSSDFEIKRLNRMFKAF